MAAMQGAMTDLSNPNSAYISTSVEEPELSSIDFHQSLRFFQEQLINSQGFPSPTANRLTNNDVSKFCIDFTNGHNISETRVNGASRNGTFDEGPKSLSSSRISIPTVDTILESVRVLRAIQKSQEQRGSTWSLNMAISETDLEIQKSSIFDEIKSADQSSLLNENQVQSSDTLSKSTDDEPHGSLVDKSKDISITAESPTPSSERPSFWPSHYIEKQQITRELNEKSIMPITEKQNVLQINGEITEFKNNSLLQNPPLNIESEKIIVTGENIHGILKENLQTIKHNGNFNEVFECTTTKISGIDSDSIDALYPKTNPQSDLTDLNCITKSSGSDEETSNHNSKPDLNITEVSEISQTLEKEDLRQTGSSECKMNNIENRNICKEEEYLQVSEHDIVNGDEPTLKKVDSDCSRIQRSASSTPPTPCKQLRPESWSDTCSSLYVSAECSPCPSLDNEFEFSPHIDEKIPEYQSHCVNNDSKKDNLFDVWTTDSSGISADLANDSNTSESTSSLSSTSIDTNILDNGQISDTVPKEVTVSSPCVEGIPTNDGEILDIKSTSTETVTPIATHEDSYQSCTLIDLKSTSPSSTTTENSVNTNDLSNFTSDNRTHEINEDCSVKNISLQHSTDTNAYKINEELDTDKSSNSNKICKSKEVEDDANETHGIKKFTTSSWNLEAITQSLYTLPEPAPTKVFPANTSYEKTVVVMSQGSFCKYPEGNYTLKLQQKMLWIMQKTNSLMTMPLDYAEVCIINRNSLKVDNKLGRCLYFKSDTQEDLMDLKEKLQLHCLKCWESESINLVHYPLRCHQNIIIIDLGSCSTRAGILMDQPTLPFLFFPSVCATDKTIGNHVYGKEALQLETRQNSNLSFPLRPSIKILKHSIDIDLVGGLFKKIFQDLRVDPVQYTVQVCLPRTLSISVQNALVKLLLEDVKVQSVSLTHQALLTLYAHNVSTGVIVDIGDRMDILPVVDGFIVESGVTRLPYGGQRLIHHMKHALAEKHISLSNDIDSFVVQYISENLSYVAEDYDTEIKMATQFPEIVKKTITLETFARDDKCAQFATLEDARFKTPEGLFKPSLWGLDNPGIHKLVQKAIQATSVDVRKKVAENIYVSGGVTLIPGFVERLNKEVSNLNKPRIIPKVIASNYRYHCTYIGACEFARLEVFPKVCVNIEEYTKDQISSLKKFVMCF